MDAAHGFGTSKPILSPLDNTECRDAILSPDGTEPDWPQTDVVIGNPPFLGGKLLIRGLREEYVARLFDVYRQRVPHEADLVTYWFAKAAGQLAFGETDRVGLVATNSICGGANRRALAAATEGSVIYDAWSDEPWVIDGAAVRVSLVCFAREDAEHPSDPALDGKPVDAIFTDLTARRGDAGVDLTTANRLRENAGVAFMGDTKGGAFEIPGNLAPQWLRLPANPNGRPNAEVLKPWANGMDITRRSAGKWIVDFGLSMEEGEAALYEGPFQYIRETAWKSAFGFRRYQPHVTLTGPESGAPYEPHRDRQGSPGLDRHHQLRQLRRPLPSPVETPTTYFNPASGRPIRVTIADA